MLTTSTWHQSESTVHLLIADVMPTSTAMVYVHPVLQMLKMETRSAVFAHQRSIKSPHQVQLGVTHAVKYFNFLIFAVLQGKA